MRPESVADFESEAKAQARERLVPDSMTADEFEATWLRLVKSGEIAYADERDEPAEAG